MPLPVLARLLTLGLSCTLLFHARAGGSGLNTVVVANANSANSCALANYYLERREIPPEHLLRIAWSGGNSSWTSAEFQAVLLEPLLALLASGQLTQQIHYVVLSMDIPFQTVSVADGAVNSTTSALFYGVRSPSAAVNSYCASEALFSEAAPTNSAGAAFLCTMLTAESLAQAKQLVDQGVLSDGSFPQQPVVLAKSSDPARNIRYAAFDNAIFNVNLRGVSSMLRTNTDSLWAPGQVLGYETGLANYSVSVNKFVPGAMADSLTSFGGVIFGPNGQTSLLALINAGACGAYGTVSEPGTDALKFPDPQLYFYQARGFTVAECYYQSLNTPLLGLTVAEPLAAPFCRVGSGRWIAAGTNSTLSGACRLAPRLTAADAGHLLQKLDLFVDGKYFSTLTNCGPLPGNRLTVTFNGYPVSCTVPPNATLGTVATNLAAAINAPGVTNFTQVAAAAHGDRIELRFLAPESAAGPFYVAHDPGTNSGSRFYSVSYLPYPVPPQIAMTGGGAGGAARIQVHTPDPMPYVIEAGTNLVDWVPLYTNVAGGDLGFIDRDATNGPARFYRASGSPSTPPQPDPPIYTVQQGPNGYDLVQVSYATRPYQVEVSPDQVNWTSFFTNLSPGEYQLHTSSSPGTTDTLTTFVTAAQPAFLKTEAYGLQQYRVTRSTLSSGAWLQFTITKTNGTVVLMGLTNLVNGASSTNFTRQFYDLLNSTLALQGSDGAVAEDFTVNAAGTASFNLRARSAGWPAALIQVLPRRSGPTIFPSTQSTLTWNASDLQPRNHLYVTAGCSSLGPAFMLDTTALPDGFHELAAVAYEGSHVGSQTKITLPVQIQNSTLSASLTLVDLTNNAPVQGTYQVRVAANTNAVATISLFSTGGRLDSVTNQSAVTFTVNGATLGAGRHPFYALVETTAGLKYRTEMQWVRLAAQ